MRQIETAVVYDGLPVSSGGAHSINRLSVDAAIAAWRHFLQACAHQLVVDGFLRVSDGPGPPAHPEILSQLDTVFPTRRESSVRLHQVPESRIDEAVEFMKAISPQATDEYGNAAIMLGLDAHFLLGEPGGDGLWPHQGRELFGQFETPTGVQLGVSSSRLNIMSGRSMGLMLTLPSASDDHVIAARSWLQEHVPFRLSDKHWTRWTLNSNGTTYRPKRLTRRPAG